MSLENQKNIQNTPDSRTLDIKLDINRNDLKSTNRNVKCQTTVI